MQTTMVKKREKKAGSGNRPRQGGSADFAKGRENTEEQVFKAIFQRKPLSQMETIEMSRTGVAKRSLVLFMHYFKFSADQVSRMLPVTLRTIQRYSSKQRFNAVVSEHIIQLVALMAKGVEVFGDREKFLRWFNAPNKPLGGTAPSDLVSLKTGAQMVMDELGRIEHGIFV